MIIIYFQCNFLKIFYCLFVNRDDDSILKKIENKWNNNENKKPAKKTIQIEEVC